MASVTAKKSKKPLSSKKSVSLDTNTEKKQSKRGQHLLKYAVKPGEVRNPAGRPKGSRNKLGEEFLSALLEDFREHGASAVKDCRETDPAAYCRIIASIIPKEITINDEERVLDKFLEQFTTVEEIKEFRQQLEILSGGDRCITTSYTEETD